MLNDAQVVGEEKEKSKITSINIRIAMALEICMVWHWLRLRVLLLSMCSTKHEVILESKQRHHDIPLNPLSREP